MLNLIRNAAKTVDFSIKYGNQVSLINAIYIYNHSMIGAITMNEKYAKDVWSSVEKFVWQKMEREADKSDTDARKWQQLSLRVRD